MISTRSGDVLAMFLAGHVWAADGGHSNEPIQETFQAYQFHGLRIIPELTLTTLYVSKVKDSFCCVVPG